MTNEFLSFILCHMLTIHIGKGGVQIYDEVADKYVRTNRRNVAKAVSRDDINVEFNDTKADLIAKWRVHKRES